MAQGREKNKSIMPNSSNPDLLHAAQGSSSCRVSDNSRMVIFQRAQCTLFRCNIMLKTHYGLFTSGAILFFSGLANHACCMHCTLTTGQLSVLEGLLFVMTREGEPGILHALALGGIRPISALIHQLSARWLARLLAIECMRQQWRWLAGARLPSYVNTYASCGMRFLCAYTRRPLHTRSDRMRKKK
jgi:hypothetical protein